MVKIIEQKPIKQANCYYLDLSFVNVMGRYTYVHIYKRSHIHKVKENYTGIRLNLLQKHRNCVVITCVA